MACFRVNPYILRLVVYLFVVFTENAVILTLKPTMSCALYKDALHDMHADDCLNTLKSSDTDQYFPYTTDLNV
jgi:hypothetical protein